MAMDILILLVEYSGVPIGLLLYSVIIKQLSSSDPIPLKEKSEGVWAYGLELMAIVSVSTLLYGISFGGHTNGADLSHEKLLCVIWCFAISIVEFFFLVFFTLKVRKWGKDSSLTKLCPNLIAFGYWLILVALIIFCSNYTHPAGVKNPDAPRVEELSSTPWLKKGNNIFWAVGIAAIFAVIGITILFKKMIVRIKRKAIAEYNKGAQSLAKSKTAEEPAVAIKNLTDSLNKIPDSSPLILDIYMKLTKLYTKMSQWDLALAQINKLENTTVYKSLQSYLKDEIIRSKAQVLVNMGDIQAAENLIPAIISKEAAAKLKLMIYETKTAK